MDASTKLYIIANRYVFNEVFSRVELARPLIEGVMGRPVGSISCVSAERAIEPSLRGRGVRMDVQLEGAEGDAYDLEMQARHEVSIELRSRYLLSAFDRDRIKRGEDYDTLKPTTVIFVCTYDPLGRGLRRYTYRMRCDEDGAKLNDGNLLVLLNASGARGEESDTPLGRFLAYVDGGDTMGDEWIEEIDRTVRAINSDEGWRSDMLGYELDMMDERREGRREAVDLDRRLAEALRDAGRGDELMDALLDPARREALLAEFGLGLGDAAAG